MRTKTLWVREPYLAQILARRKTIEIRVGYDNIRRLEPGDRLKLNDRHLVTISRIGNYATFDELLVHESPQAIAPDLSPDQLLATLREIYSQDKESLGVVALEVQYAPDVERAYDVVLFDLGYTLIYFEPKQEIVVQEALRAIGAEFSVDQIQAIAKVVWGSYFGDAEIATFPPTEEHDRETESELQRGLLTELGLPGDRETQRAYADLLEEGFSRPGVIRPYPEVVEVLTALQEQGYRLGIVSNWSWNLRDRVAQVGLEAFFEIVWASAYAGCNKPHPDIFYQALTKMDVSPQRAFYVGDSYEHDVIGARNAGLDVALLDRDGTSEASDCSIIGDLWGLFDLLAGGSQE